MARGDLLSLIEVLSGSGALFVYSMIHVDECQNSDRAEVFVDILEGISAHLLEHSDPKEKDIVLSPNRARELLLAKRDILDEAMRRMEDMLKPMHFLAGWLDEVEAQELRDELVEGISSFWMNLETELPRQLLERLTPAKNELLRSINYLSLAQFRDESRVWQMEFRAKLPKNYAQLDAVPDDEVAEFLIARLDADGQKEVEAHYPKGFWSKVEARKEGSLTGFAFMLFMMGIVRDPRVKRGDRKHRNRHFLGQFRDCAHIELASRCALFITFDKGAARLAKAVYAYAGVATQVVNLAVREP